MRHALQVELLKELLKQLDEGVNADAGGLRKNPTSAYTCPDLALLEHQEFFLPSSSGYWAQRRTAGARLVRHTQ